MINLTIEGLLAGLGGALVTAILGYFGVVRKAKADETSIALNAWKELLEPLQKELREAKEEIKQLRIALEEAEERHKRETARLTTRLRDLQKYNDKQ